MTVLVELEVPNSCADCPFANETEGAYHDYCAHPNAGYSTDISKFLSRTCDERPGWCPFNTAKDVVLGEMTDYHGIGCRFKITDEHKLVSLEVKTDETA